MSALRPTLFTGKANDPCLTNGTAYMTILAAVKRQAGLIHGKLHADGAHCAIGSYFEINKAGLPADLVDEVATVNDSVPHLTPAGRKRYVVKWLKWKLEKLGMKI